MEETSDEQIFNLQTPPYLPLILRSSPPPPPSPAQEGAGESNYHQLGTRGVLLVRGFTASPQCTDDILSFQKTIESTLKIPTLTQEDFENDENYCFTLKPKKNPKPAYEDDEYRRNMRTKNYACSFGQHHFPLAKSLCRKKQASKKNTSKSKSKY